MTDPKLPDHKDVADEEKEREFHELVFPPECKHESHRIELSLHVGDDDVGTAAWCSDCGALCEELGNCEALGMSEVWKIPGECQHENVESSYELYGCLDCGARRAVR